jgi:hypothetical protein
MEGGRVAAGRGQPGSEVQGCQAEAMQRVGGAGEGGASLRVAGGPVN